MCSENDYKYLPEDLTPINIKAYFYNCFGACGCSELGEMVVTIKRLLEWHAASQEDSRANYESLYGELGVFYLLSGMLENLDLADHGSSIRFPWLSGDGRRLLEALQKYLAEEIDDASGEAYDGLHYGGF